MKFARSFWPSLAFLGFLHLSTRGLKKVDIARFSSRANFLAWNFPRVDLILVLRNVELVFPFQSQGIGLNFPLY
jgi:hypothetical protein